MVVLPFYGGSVRAARHIRSPYKAAETKQKLGEVLVTAILLRVLETRVRVHLSCHHCTTQSLVRPTELNRGSKLTCPSIGASALVFRIPPEDQKEKKKRLDCSLQHLPDINGLGYGLHVHCLERCLYSAPRSENATEHSYPT